MGTIPPQFMDVDIDVSDPSALDKVDLARAIERDLLSPAQLVDLGLDTPDKVQAALRHDEPAWNPASVEASGNHLTLTEEEVELIRQRREKAENAPTPKIRTSDAVNDDDDEDDDDEDEALEPPYDDHTNDALRGEIVRRNEGRDEESKLSVSGNKAELIETLENDDAANEE